MEIITKPFDFQKEALVKIHEFNGRAMLCLEQRLGKTLVSLMYAAAHPELRPIVIVCPASVKWNWANEIRTHTGLASQILEGRTPVDGEQIHTPKTPWIVNYDILEGWMGFLKELDPKLVILDENHFIKGSSKRTKMVKRLCEGVGHVLALSGTPLTNRPAELWNTIHLLRPDVFKSKNAYYSRYCLPKEAPILMADLTEKPIHEVRVGDYVIGWAKQASGLRRLQKVKVLDLLTKKSVLQKVTLENGDSVICTPDHKWATGHRVGSPSEYLEARTGRTSGRGRGIASQLLKIFTGTSPLYRETTDYQLGYIHGFWRGDGHCIRKTVTKEYPFRGKTTSGTRTHIVGCGCKDTEPVDRVSQYLTNFGMPHQKRPCPDGIHRIWMHHEEGYKFITSSQPNSDDWWAGFLGGIYDAEGSGQEISQYMHINPQTHDLIVQALNHFSIPHSFDSMGKSVRMRGGRPMMLRFWDIANPTLRRKLISYVMRGGGRFTTGGIHTMKTSPRVTNITPLEGVHDTYTLTTETGNYVAYGYGSKNCNLRRTRWGWDYSGAKNLGELHELLCSSMMIRYRMRDVLKYLPPRTDHLVMVGMDDPSEYHQATRNFVGWLSNKKGKITNSQRAEQITKLVALKQLVGRLKLPAVYEWLDRFLEETDEKIIVFGYHRDTVESIHERYKDVSVMVHGGVVGRKRQERFEEFSKSKKVRLLSGNVQAAGVGWPGHAACNVAFVEYPWEPGTLSQAAARPEGIAQNRPVSIFYLVTQDTLEPDLLKLLERKAKVLSQTLDGKKIVGDFDIYSKLAKVISGEAKT